MGEGMKRASAAAKATRVKTYDVATSHGTYSVMAETSDEARKIIADQIDKPGVFIISCKVRG